MLKNISATILSMEQRLAYFYPLPAGRFLRQAFYCLLFKA